MVGANWRFTEISDSQLGAASQLQFNLKTYGELNDDPVSYKIELIAMPPDVWNFNDSPNIKCGIQWPGGAARGSCALNTYAGTSSDRANGFIVDVQSVVTAAMNPAKVFFSINARVSSLSIF